MPVIADHFFLRVGWSEGQFHVWDLHGFVASTDDPNVLADWLQAQQISSSYFGLRELLFPDFKAEKQEALGALAGGHIHLGRSRFKREPKQAPVDLHGIDGDDLLQKLGL